MSGEASKKEEEIDVIKDGNDNEDDDEEEEEEDGQDQGKKKYVKKAHGKLVPVELQIQRDHTVNVEEVIHAQVI